MSESLRDTLTSAFEEHVEGTTPEAPAAPVEGVQDATIPGEGNNPPKPGRTAGRARDEQGRLLPGPAKKEPQISAAEGKASPAQTPTAQTAQPAPAAETKPRPARPSSWKKDFWGHWDQLDPTLAEYISQREGEYAKGVSTYKTEYDRLKPLGEAMQEFEPLLKQNNIEPSQWIRNLGNAHRLLAGGLPQEKLSMFLKLAQDYQVPLQALFTQGQDGKVYFNPQVQPYQAPQQQAPQRSVDEIAEEKVAQILTQRTIAAFEAEAPTKYPHYEAVKQTMAGLLQAELATDLEDAYNQALALPRHSDLSAQVQAEKARREAEEKAKQVARARTQAVSPKGSTPTAPSGEKPKGVRAAISDAWDQHVGDGRV